MTIFAKRHLILFIWTKIEVNRFVVQVLIYTDVLVQYIIVQYIEVAQHASPLLFFSTSLSFLNRGLLDIDILY